MHKPDTVEPRFNEVFVISRFCGIHFTVTVFGLAETDV